jgi:type II secretory pathway pseudopilin PulG
MDTRLMRKPMNVGKTGRRARGAAWMASGFTLVESVVAIGIFAFVIVGIVGLFGTALERQRQASFETRAVMVSQQMLARLRAAESATNVAFTRGSDEDTDEKYYHTNDLTSSPTNTVEIYYKQDGTEISGVLATNNYEDEDLTIFSDYPAEGSPEDVVGRARMTLTTNDTGNPNLYRVTIEVSEPANLPLDQRGYRADFTTYQALPN